MDGTSTDALVAFCSCLAQSAHSTRAKIRKMTENDQLDESTGKPLQFLAIKLAHFEHHVDQLQTCLTEASTLSPGLHDLVASPLPTCSNAATILTQQMEDLGPDKVGQTAGLETIRKYQELINAHQGIFILATQLLVVDSGAYQDEKGRTADAKDMVRRASASCNVATRSQVAV